jgi:hypothetical protein
MSYKKRRYTRRRNPGMPKMFRFLNRRFLMRSASFGGGLAAGYVAMPLYVRFLPAPFTANYRRFYGALNLLLGGMIFTASKRSAGRNIGSAIAGTGVYDLVAKLLPDLGLPALPNSSAMIEGMLPEETDTEAVSANFNPALMGANYEPRGLSANYEPESTGLGANYTPALFGGCGSPDGGM